MSIFLDQLMIELVLRPHADRMGTRPNDRHVATQYVQELRQFIQAGSPQKGTKRRDPFVIAARLARARVIRRIDPHSAELEHLEFAAVEAVATLTEQHGA